MRAITNVFGICVLALAGTAAWYLALVAPVLLGMEGEHMQGDAVLALVLLSPVVAMVAVGALAWRAQRRAGGGGRAWTAVVCVLGLVLLIGTETMTDSALAVAGAAVTGRLQGFADGAFRIAVDQATYFAYPGQPGFWFSACILLAVLAGLAWILGTVRARGDRAA
jgi:hypothetical protein